MVVNTMTLPDSISCSDEQDEEHRQLKLIAEGDDRAFKSLYLHYHPRLYRFTSRLLNNSAMVEEVVSDTLFAVWKSAGSFKGKSRVSTWIFGIGYRTALKAIRSSARHDRFTNASDDSDTLVDTSAGNDPAALAETDDDTEQLLAAIETLSTEQKVVVELTGFGWSCAEIGEIVGCPTNTVKTRMFNARKKIHRQLQARHSDYITE
jgi:RNA polymerase sigma-70 factor (ECF subfamily)